MATRHNPLLRSLSMGVGPAALIALLACGGRVIGVDDGGAESDSNGGDHETSCVDIDLSKYDQSCNQASDCLSVTAGLLCPGKSCLCGGSFINQSEGAKYQAAVAPLGNSIACPCPAELAPQCVQNVCQACDLTSNPSGCFNSDAQAPTDSSPPDGDTSDTSLSDGGQCVDIDLSTFDRSCMTMSDCIEITAGTICTGGCSCGGSSINQSGQARYDAAINSIMTAACPCVFPGTPTCVQGECIMCNAPEGADPADCQDSGP
jgi:hypothetical protein